MPSPIQDYALIGDGASAALVSRTGSIDWLCWPQFASPACMTALLGTEEHGSWRVAPVDAAGVWARTEVSRRYRPDTLVLETRFRTAEGEVELLDFMPRREGAPALVRILTGVSGRVAVRTALSLRFDYGSLRPWATCSAREFRAVVGPDLLVLRTECDIADEGDAVSGTLTLAPGQSVALVLQWGLSYGELPAAVDPRAKLAQTEEIWRGWIGRFTKETPWPEAVRRSLITLRALTDHDSGGIVAAPTAGLPERPGGRMNWDYRYCWLRDATFTLAALLNAGFREEATAWRDWLLRSVGGNPEKMRILYRMDGGRHVEEWNADWLPGHMGARPVRIGNAAAGQFQLDTYGEVLDAMHMSDRAGIERRSYGLDVERILVEHVERVWREPDQGLWESRDAPQHYVYSKVMAWVAVDRFLEGEHTGRAMDAATRARLTALRTAMHAEICERGFSRRHNSFTAHYGGGGYDASVLLLPIVNFLPATDPRMLATVEAVRVELMQDGLVRRYPSPILGGEEGAFLACSFWYADNLQMQGRKEEAHEVIERVLALRNDVGLLSEEYHVGRKELIGNFPQALSHLSLVNSALSLGGHVLRRG